jgi:hypothetical protein
MLPTLGLCALWVGIGASSVLASGDRQRRQLLAGVLVIGIACQLGVPPALARVAESRVSRVRTLPFRNEARYWLVPWKHTENSAQQFTEAMDRQLQAGDVVIGDLTAVNPVQVARTIGLVSSKWRLMSGWSGESEEEILGAVEQALRQGGRVFVVSPVAGYAPDALLEKYDFEREGVLWRAKKKR